MLPEVESHGNDFENTLNVDDGVEDGVGLNDEPVHSSVGVNLGIIENDYSLKNAYAQYFSRAGYSVYLIPHDENEFTEYLAELPELHFILSDYRLGERNGIFFIQKLREEFNEDIVKELRSRARDVLLTQRSQPETPWTPASFAAIRAPTLVMVGEKDALIPPANGRALARAIPDAYLVTYPEGGHLPMEQLPDQTVRPRIVKIYRRRATSAWRATLILGAGERGDIQRALRTIDCL